MKSNTLCAISPPQTVDTCSINAVSYGFFLLVARPLTTERPRLQDAPLPHEAAREPDENTHTHRVESHLLLQWKVCLPPAGGRLEF